MSASNRLDLYLRGSTQRILSVGISIFLFSGLITACEPESKIEFHVCGNLQVPEQIDALRVSILDDSMTEVRAGLIELVPRDLPLQEGSIDPSQSEEEEEDVMISSGGHILQLPVSVSLPNHHGSGFFRVQGLLEGVEAARFDRSVHDFEKIQEVDMKLDERCYGMMSCAPGQSCVKGSCELAPDVGQAPYCP